MWTKLHTPAATGEFQIYVRYQHASTSKLDTLVSHRTFDVLFIIHSLQLRAVAEWTAFSPLCIALGDKNVLKMLILINSSIRLLKDIILGNKNRMRLRSFLFWLVLFHAFFFTLKLWQSTALLHYRCPSPEGEKQDCDYNVTTEPSALISSSGLSCAMLKHTAKRWWRFLLYAWLQFGYDRIFRDIKALKSKSLKKS